MDYLLESFFHPRGRDIDGKRIFFSDSILHLRGTKDVKDMKRMFIYWFERILREENYDKMTMVMDLTDCGLKHADMELIMYQTNVLKLYYPNTINWMLVYSLPWILNGSKSFKKAQKLFYRFFRHISNHQKAFTQKTRCKLEDG